MKALDKKSEDIIIKHIKSVLFQAGLKHTTMVDIVSAIDAGDDFYKKIEMKQIVREILINYYPSLSPIYIGMLN